MKLYAYLEAGLKGLLIAGVMSMAGCVSGPQAPIEIPKPVFPPAPEEARFFFERTLYSSADVLEEDPNEAIKRMLVGGSRSGEGLGKPYGVAVFQGQVFVADSALRAVVVFDIPGKRFFRIGEDGAGALVMPLGLDLDGKGNLYVVDGGSKQIQVFDKGGKFLRTIGGPTFFSKPTGIAVDAAGTRVYVVETGGVQSQDHRIRVFDAVTAKHLFDFGKRGTGPGEFNLPRDVTIGKDDLLYVVDGGNFRVQVFKPDGTFVRVFGGIGRQGGQFSRPKEGAADLDGNIYVVDSAFGNFQIFNPEGQLLLSVGGRGNVDGPAMFMLPAGIAVDGDGRVYMADQFFRKVDVFRPAKLDENAGFVAKASKKK